MRLSWFMLSATYFFLCGVSTPADAADDDIVVDSATSVSRNAIDIQRDAVVSSNDEAMAQVLIDLEDQFRQYLDRVNQACKLSDLQYTKVSLASKRDVRRFAQVLSEHPEQVEMAHRLNMMA